MATYPLPTLGPTIDSTGISIPSYNDVYQSLIALFQGIYGSDIYIDPDSQDGQWIAVIAKAVDDCNKACVAVFNSFSPTYAIGTQLASLIKINGLTKLISTKSSVDVTITGTVGTIISNGIVSDDAGATLWNLPPTVTIPGAGFIVVTAVAQDSGNITAAPNTVTKISNPQRGWQSVNNNNAASPGAPVEQDPAVRLRQAISVSIPSQTVLEGIEGAIANLTGVTAVRYYENITGSTDANGIPSGNVAFVVQGGNSAEIASTLAAKKTAGVPTYGNTTVAVVDAQGNSHDIKYSVPTPERIVVAISLHGFANYTTIIGDSIKQSVADYINALGIGNKVMITRLQVPAQLYGNPDSLNYEIVTITACIFGGSLASTDISIAFNQIATCQVSDITISTV